MSLSGSFDLEELSFQSTNAEAPKVPNAESSVPIHSTQVSQAETDSSNLNSSTIMSSFAIEDSLESIEKETPTEKVQTENPTEDTETIKSKIIDNNANFCQQVQKIRKIEAEQKHYLEKLCQDAKNSSLSNQLANFEKIEGFYTEMLFNKISQGQEIIQGQKRFWHGYHAK